MSSISFCFWEKSAAHLDAIVGPAVIASGAIEDVRYIADDAQSRSIVLA